MDIVYLLIAGVLWLAVYGLAARLCSVATTREPAMSTWTVLAAVLVAGLLIYLVAVLLHPEDFS